MTAVASRAPAGAGRWWYPDVGLEPEHVAFAAEFVDALPYRDRIVAALATGSRAAGLAHARSDLDLLVVLAEDEDRGRYRTHPRRYGDLTVDADLLIAGDVRRHLANQRVRETARVLHRGLYALPDFTGWQTLVRLAIGHVVTATPAARALLGSLDRDAVRRSVMVHAVLCLATFAEDAQGSLECGDLATALAAAEEAVRYGVEVGLTALDDVYVGRKYLLRRAARHPSLAALLGPAGDLLGQPGAELTDADIRALVHRRLLLAGHLAGSALTAAWQRPASSLPPFSPGGDGPVRDPCLVPVRWPGGLGLMTGVELVHRLPAEAVVLFALLDGRPVGDVVAEFAARTGTDRPRAERYVSSTVDDWSERGLVHEPHG